MGIVILSLNSSFRITMEKNLMKKVSKVDIIYVNVAKTNFKTIKENAMMLNTNVITIMQKASCK